MTADHPPNPPQQAPQLGPTQEQASAHNAATSPPPPPPEKITEDTWFIPTTQPPADIAQTVRSAAKRGALPGYNQPKQTDHLFTITDFGSPFESRLTVTHNSTPAQGLTLRTAIKPITPIAIAAVLVLTVFPGVYLTDMFIREFFPGTLAARWVWWWHIGLSAPFLPFAFRTAWRKSQTTGREAAGKHAQSIQRLLRSLEAAQHKQADNT